jgi:hypothetical protein
MEMETKTAAASLTAANQVFHAAYGHARTSSGVEAPLLVASLNELALHGVGERRAFPVSHPPFDTAKVVAHIAVALYTMTREIDGGELPVEIVLRLESLRAHIPLLLSELKADQAGDGQALRDELVPLLELAAAYTERALSERQAPAPGRDDFARECGPRILRATELATEGQLGALDRSFCQVMEQLSPEQRRQLQVVVVGDHQARSRSLGMQYFRRRLGEPEGVEERVTYGENVESEEEAIALVGTRRLDRSIAGAFFGDEKRLQRDILGDAATRVLDRMQCAPL